MFLIFNITTLLGKAVGITIGDTKMNVSVHDDDAGALVLNKTLPLHFILCSNYYAIKTILVREKIVKRMIKLLKIDTVENLWDLYTEGLPRTTF